MFFAMSHHQTFWEDYLTGFIAFAPLTKIPNISEDTLFSKLAEQYDSIVAKSEELNFWSALNAPFESVEGGFCSNFQDICSFQNREYNPKDNDMNKNDEESYYWYNRRNPSGTSIQNLLHYAQLYKSGNFQLFDWGSPENNYEYYGTTTPPIIDLSNLAQVPILMWTARDDTVSTLANA